MRGLYSCYPGILPSSRAHQICGGGEYANGTRNVHWIVGTLRKTLRAAQASWWVQTVWKEGYRLRREGECL